MSVAEADVKQAEGEVRPLETAENEIARNIQHTQAGIANLQTSTSHDVHSGERYIQALQMQRKLIQQSREKAMCKLDQERMDRSDARTKIIEKSRNVDCIRSSPDRGPDEVSLEEVRRRTVLAAARGSE